LIFIFSKYEFT